MLSAIIQMNVGQDKAANIAQAERLAEAVLAEARPRLFSFPETWTVLGGTQANKEDLAEMLPAPGSDQAAGRAYAFLRDLARRAGAYVHGGSIHERQGDRLYNTTLVFDPRGRELARYRKIHLFDIVTPDGTAYRESDSVGSGDAVVTFDLDGMTCGLAICYDVRFPELFRALRDKGAETIFLPAAFTAQTGKDHWEPLIRARAIETQCWFIAAATWGGHRDAAGAPRATYGHSLACDPWGHVVARASDGVGYALARIDRDLVGRVRRDIPLAAHRRLPLGACAA
jgi:deaminated glutathione amidase